jgi:hypothetical protein
MPLAQDLQAEIAEILQLVHYWCFMMNVHAVENTGRMKLIIGCLLPLLMTQVFHASRKILTLIIPVPRYQLY